VPQPLRILHLIRSLNPAGRAGAAFLALILLACLSELGLRLTGILDFPTYLVDDRIGYLPRPNQAGSFLNRNRWQINEKSQGSEAWQPNLRPDLLLIGDSIVWGGNPIDQPDKLGPTLERHLPGIDVWSAAAGSWAVPNEIEYMDRFPEVVSASEYVVWILNSGDLGSRTQWSSELTHPQRHPPSALLYTFDKYLLPRLQARFSMTAAQGPTATVEQTGYFNSETEAQFRDRLHQLSEHARVVVVLWPTRRESQGAVPDAAIYESFAARVQALAAGTAMVLDTRGALKHKDELFRDGIHPTPAGNDYLANLIAPAIRVPASESADHEDIKP
jgi:hypothetical protein